MQNSSSIIDLNSIPLLTIGIHCQIVFVPNLEEIVIFTMGCQVTLETIISAQQ